MEEQTEVPPRNKEELLNRVRTSHDELEGTLALLRHGQMTEPLLEGGWSVKDVLHHITAWEDLTMQRLRVRSNPEELVRVQEQIAGTDTDERNDALYRAGQNLSLPEVRINYNKTHEELMALLEEIPEDDLLLPNRFPIWNGDPLGRLVAGNTYFHYDEHREAIEKILRHTKEEPNPV